MKKNIDALTGVRFLAAFLVFVFHLNMRSKMLFLPWPVYNIVSHGAFGVTVFFVLSGFLLTYSHLKDFPKGEFQTQGYNWRFLYKRLARIYPAYLVGLLLYAAVGAYFHQPHGLAYILADATMVQAAFPSLAMAWYGSGAWSVSIEIYFYLFFPFLLPLLLRIERKQTLWLLLAAVVAAGSAAGLSYPLWTGWMDRLGYPLLYAHPLFRCSEFIAGMIASLLVFRFGWRAKEWQALASLAFAGAYIAGFGPRLIGFVPHNWAVVPAVVILLAAIVDVQRTKVLRVLAHPVLVYAGKVSYCFYLMQLPLFFLQDIYLTNHPSLPVWSTPTTLVTTLVLAVLLHHGVEVPAHKWLLNRLPRARVVPAPVAV